MLGAFKARAAPFNVNYRYVDEELVYLLPRRRRARGRLPRALRADARAHPRRSCRDSRCWLQVADGSGEPLLPGALDYEAALAARGAGARRAASRPTTSTSSTPAARPACRRACSGARRTSSAPRSRRGSVPRRASTTLVERARKRPRAARAAGAAVHARRGALGRVQHVALGGTIVVQSQPERLDPARHLVDGRARARRTRSRSSATPSRGRSLDELARAGATTCPSLQLLTLGRRDPHRGAQGELLGRLPGRDDPRRARLLRERPAGARR